MCRVSCLWLWSPNRSKTNCDVTALVAKATPDKSKVFYHKMKADYHRHIAGFKAADDKEKAAEHAGQAHEKASGSSHLLTSCIELLCVSVCGAGQPWGSMQDGTHSVRGCNCWAWQRAGGLRQGFNFDHAAGAWQLEGLKLQDERRRDDQVHCWCVVELVNESIKDQLWVIQEKNH